MIGVATNDAGDNFGGGTAFALEMEGWRHSRRAQNLIGLVVQRDGLAIAPNAPKLERLDFAAPKSKKIKLRMASGKIDRDRVRHTDAFPAKAGHADVWPMNEHETVPGRRFPKKMKGVTNAKLRMTDAKIFAAGGVQFVPDIARQLHPHLRRVFANEEKWRCLSLIARFDFRRQDLGDHEPENAGDQDRESGTLQSSWNPGNNCAQATTQVFETEMCTGTVARTQSARTNPNRDQQSSHGKSAGEIVNFLDRSESVPFCLQRERKSTDEIGRDGQGNCDKQKRDSSNRAQQEPFTHGQAEHDSGLQGTHAAASFGYAHNTS